MREPGRDPERPSQDAGEASASAATEHAETSGASEASTEAAIEPEPEPATASRTEPEAPDASAREVSYEEGERERDSRPRALRIYALIAGGVAAGVLPRLQPLPELSLSLEQGEPGDVLWSAHAAFRISPDQTRHFDQGVVTFGWWTSLTALCAGARGAQLSASGCAAVEVGALSGAATGTQRPRDERRAWVALGPGLTLAWDVTPALRLQLRGELLTPLTRYSLELPGGTAVHEPGTLGLRAALGAGLRLP